MADHDELSDLDDKDREFVEDALLMKDQAEKVLGMTELMDALRRGQAIAEEKRDTTFGDEHFVWVGRCIQVRELFFQLEKAAAFEVSKEKKRVNSYV